MVIRTFEKCNEGILINKNVAIALGLSFGIKLCLRLRSRVIERGLQILAEVNFRPVASLIAAEGVTPIGD